MKKILILLSIFLVAALCKPKNFTGSSTRDSIYDLTHQERVIYMQGLRSLNHGPFPTKWHYISHQFSLTEQYRDVRLMLTWNRMLLHKLEAALQSIDPRIKGIPYWNWNKYGHNPISDPVFGPKYFGSLKEFWIYSKRGTDFVKLVYLNRSLPDENGIFPVFSYNNNIFKIKDLSLFSNHIKSINSIVSYNLGDSSTFDLGRHDPLFYSQLAYLDMMYSYWLQLHDLSEEELYPKLKLIPWDLTINEVLNHDQASCIVYR